MSRFPSAAVLLIVSLSFAAAPGSPLTSSREKTAVLKGSVYRADKEHGVAGAEIVLMDDKSDDEGDTISGLETKTDAQGNFVFEQVAEGKYTVSIRTWYDKLDDVPCQLIMAKTRDKKSALLVVPEGNKYVEQIFIRGFIVKAGKENVKDFDIACLRLSAK